MDHATQVEQIRQIFHQLDNKTCVLGDRMAINSSRDYYTDPGQFLHEREILFKSTPVVVGLSDQLREPGDFFTVKDTGIPTLVVRSRSGELNAFLNACRHRSSAVEMEPCGKGKKIFTCPFHAWAYDTDGKLIGVPDPWGFPDLDREKHGLIPLPVAERHGLVWVLADPKGTLDLDDFLGPLDEEFSFFKLHEYKYFDTNVRTLRMNWKIALDTFGETYHVQMLHKDSVLSIFHPTVITFEKFGRHSRMCTTRRTLETMRDLPEEEWDLLGHSTMVYYVYPNTFLLWQMDHVQVFRLFPGSHVGESVLHTTVLSPGPVKSEQEEAHWRRNLDYVVNVTEEDFSMGPTIHDALSTGMMDQVVFGTYEPALVHFHTSLREALGLEGLQQLEPTPVP